MKIRSVTVSADVALDADQQGLGRLASLAGEVRGALEAEGFDVQTVRLATSLGMAVESQA